MINCNQLVEYIIKPALNDLNLYSDSALQLMLFTCANETQGGTFLKQNKGDALGIYQMEPKTYNDIWFNFLLKPVAKNLNLILINKFDCPRIPQEDRLIYDLRFATAMTRIFYYRLNAELPPANDLNAIWNFYKRFYNTYNGKAEYNLAMQNYDKFTSGFNLGIETSLKCS